MNDAQIKLAIRTTEHVHGLLTDYQQGRSSALRQAIWLNELSKHSPLGEVLDDKLAQLRREVADAIGISITAT